MTSKIKLKRICERCGREFTARTTVTRFCGDDCAKRAYKDRVRNFKIESSNMETQRIISKPFEELKSKEFLTVRDLAVLLNCSVRSVYNSIESGNILAVNLGKRLTRVKRSELEKIFENSRIKEVKEDPPIKDISQCYSTEQVREKYGISDSTLNNLIVRNRIPKFRQGWYVYVPKIEIDKILSPSKPSSV